MRHSSPECLQGSLHTRDNKDGANGSILKVFIVVITLTIIGLSASKCWAEKLTTKLNTESIFVQDLNTPISWEEMSFHCVLTQIDLEYTKLTPCKIDALGVFTTFTSIASKYVENSVAFQIQSWADIGGAPRNHFMILEGNSERSIFHPITTYFNFISEHVSFSGIQDGVLGQFVVVTGHSGRHGYSYYAFGRRDNAWISFEADSWIEDFQAQLPKGWWTLEPLLMDFGTGFALIELHRPNDSEQVGTGGMAIVQLAIRGNRFVVAKVVFANARFN